VFVQVITEYVRVTLCGRVGVSKTHACVRGRVAVSKTHACVRGRVGVSKTHACVCGRVAESKTHACVCRLLVYEVHHGDYDGSKLLHPEQLWAVVSEAQSDPRLLFLNGTHDMRFAALSDVLRLYTQTHRAAINVHTGIFRPRVTVVPEIAQFLRDSYDAASPRELRISGLDNVVLLYSIFVLVLCIVYHSIEHKLQDDGEYDPHTVVKGTQLGSDLLLFDAVFWLNNTFVVFIFMYLITAVAQPWLFLYFAVAYSFCMYCTVARDAPPTVYRPACLLTLVVAVGAKSMSTVGFFTGFFAIIVDVVNAFFTYIHLCDTNLTYLKFVNARFWTCLAQSLCLLLMYVSSVVFVAPMPSSTMFPAGTARELYPPT